MFDVGADQEEVEVFLWAFNNNIDRDLLDAISKTNISSESLKKVLIAGSGVKPYYVWCKQGFSGHKMLVAIDALKQGLSEAAINVFYKTTNTCDRMKLIKDGLLKGISVKKMEELLADNPYNETLEKRINKQLLKNEDTTEAGRMNAYVVALIMDGHLKCGDIVRSTRKPRTTIIAMAEELGYTLQPNDKFKKE